MKDMRKVNEHREYVNDIADDCAREHSFDGLDVRAYNSCKYGFLEGYGRAEKDLGWHSVNECLPEIDEEVIVLTNVIHGKEIPPARCICYGHRPNPAGWDGKNLITGKVTHREPVTYDGWNIPGVKYWMKCPKL